MPMLKKEDILPGVKVVVNEIIRTGLPSMYAGGNHDDRKEALLITPIVGGFLAGGWNVGPGTLLEVTKKPRKTNGVNSVRVRKIDEPHVEGEVYWCELRASATILVEDNL